MKKTVFLVGCLVLMGALAGCSSAQADTSGDVVAVAGQGEPKNTGRLRMKDAELVKKYAETVRSSRSCKADSDCVQIDKGCCLCDGKEAVNKKHVDALDKQRAEACGIGPCTMQMCYTDLNVKCEKNVCTGTLKHPAPFADR